MQHAAQEILGSRVLRLVEHGLRRPLLDDDAAIKEQHPIGHLPGNYRHISSASNS